MLSGCFKRWLLALGPVVLSLMLAACGGGQEAEPPAAAPQDQKTDQVEQETYNSFSSGFHQPRKEEAK